MDLQGLVVIYLGFKSLRMLWLVICMGFQVVLLKTHTKIVQSLCTALKTHAYSNNKITKVPLGPTWFQIASFTHLVSHCLIHIHILWVFRVCNFCRFYLLGF